MSKPTVSAFLNFDGRCEEAVNFYRQALDAHVDTLLRNKEAPDTAGCPDNTDGSMGPDKIMHCSFHIGDTMIMASDCRCTGKASFEGVSLALGVSTEAEADKYFAALEAGGAVEMPLQKTFWSPRFGVVVDKFGVCWMINVVTEEGN